MAKISEEDKIELEEYTRLRDFHLSEYKRYKGLLENKRTSTKVVYNPTTDAAKVYWKEKKKMDCDAVYSILINKKEEIGTGELCDVLNTKMEYINNKYDSMTFAGILGKHLKEDDRIYCYMGQVNGRRSTIWGLNEWKKTNPSVILKFKKPK